ncbi:cyclin [Aspergillus pseudotamarii]|uniref:Cyclin n=1 Tax=Aspergillus pseudotamarii TaxID=132259 RepID=A0A5N6SZ86_ASPPS|nr:cyclin [Aspergillus pseudotamarii]KAE8139081.1 cyclin [Aspergillus pseudotamarii]
MDFYLRCNALKCRCQLKEQAVVTTCSHIFCPICAGTLGLSSSNAGERHCPACQTILVNPDDVVITVLNPTEDYKTSVLSGLDPNTIMECAGRALLFWTYQTTQEMCLFLSAARSYCVLTDNSYYQEFLAKTLTEKYTGLNTQMDKVIHNANTEISILQTRLSDMQATHEQLQKKNQELVDLYREKCKKFSQITNLYNLLKSRAMRTHMQTAASDSVSQALNSLGASRNDPPASTSNRQVGPLLPVQTLSHRQQNIFPVDQEGVEQLHRYQRSGTGSSKGAMKRADATAMPPPSLPGNPRHQEVPMTPQHRTRLTGQSLPSTGMSHLPPNSVLLERFRDDSVATGSLANAHPSLNRGNPQLQTPGQTGNGPPGTRTFFDSTII